MGELVVDSVENATWSKVVTFWEADGTPSDSATTFSVEINGRNSKDGVLYIYKVGLELNNLNEEIQLTDKDKIPIQLSEREPFNKRFRWKLKQSIDRDGSLSGTIRFETSNGIVREPADFNRKPEDDSGYAVR